MNARVFLLLTLLTAACFAADPLPSGWSPDLDATTLFLDSELEREPAQQPMNRMTAALAEVADARLAIVYLRLYATLSPKEQSALKAEQGKWVKTRLKHAMNAIESDGGSLAPTEQALAYAEFTKARIAALEKRLAAVLKTEPKQP